MIDLKWIFKTKLNPNGTIYKDKARLVVKGYTQQYSMDYQVRHALVARYDKIKLNLAFASHSSWKIHQLDDKLSFLNSFLPEEICVENPHCFATPRKVDHVYLLNKALWPKISPKGMV